jgi:hypothetical protein
MIDSVLLLIDLIAIVVLMYWAITNDDGRPDSEVRGWFRFKQNGDRPTTTWRAKSRLGEK